MAADQNAENRQIEESNNEMRCMAEDDDYGERDGDEGF